MTPIETITVWGDSVMKGVVYDENKGRYTLLRDNAVDLASRRLGLSMRNRSRMGCTVTKGMAILQKDLQANEATDAALIEFGGNDCDFDWAAVAEDPNGHHDPKTPLAIFTAQLRDMVQTVRMKGIRPVILSLPPIHAQRYFEFFTRGGLNRDNVLHWLGDVQYIYRWHERYNNAVTHVAQDCACPIVDVREAFLAQRHYEDLLCVDGIHPNAKGHALIEKVLEAFGLSVQRGGFAAV